MLVESQRGQFNPGSGMGNLAILARSTIDPGLIEPSPFAPPPPPPPPPGCEGGGGGGRLGFSPPAPLAC